MTLRDILQQEGDQVVASLRNSLASNNVNASGRLSNSIQAEVNKAGDRLTVSAFAYIFTTEDGRAPTKNPGPGVLRPRIREWLDQKGVPEWPGMTRDAQAFVIARKIHKDGTRLFRRGGNSGVLSSVLTEELISRISLKVLTEVGENAIEGLIRASNAARSSTDAG